MQGELPPRLACVYNCLPLESTASLGPYDSSFHSISSLSSSSRILWLQRELQMRIQIHFQLPSLLLESFSHSTFRCSLVRDISIQFQFMDILSQFYHHQQRNNRSGLGLP